MDLTQAYRSQLQQVFAMFSDELAKASVVTSQLRERIAQLESENAKPVTEPLKSVTVAS